MNPISIPRYIQLSTKDSLDKSCVKNWLRSVRLAAPSGVMATIQTTDEHGMLRSVCMVCKESKKKFSYLIPLTRDLLSEEVQKIVDFFIKLEPEIDFDIETNKVEIGAEEKSAISVSDERHLAICLAMAKARHNNWMNQQIKAGWRYGMDINTDEKTHPLLRPWEQLPDDLKKPDLDSPQALLDLINSQGYVIIAKDELDMLLNR